LSRFKAEALGGDKWTALANHINDERVRVKQLATKTMWISSEAIDDIEDEGIDVARSKLLNVKFVKRLKWSQHRLTNLVEHTKHEIEKLDGTLDHADRHEVLLRLNEAATKQWQGGVNKHHEDMLLDRALDFGEQCKADLGDNGGRLSIV
jgi:hypothetical protein